MRPGARFLFRASIAAALVLAACSEGSGDPIDAGTADAGADAGFVFDPNTVPASFPLVRMNDPNAGLTHVREFQGIVSTHGPAHDIPTEFGDIVPARQMTVRDTASVVQTLYYSLPEPTSFAAFPNDQVKVLYRELVAGGIGTSYSARVESVDGDVRVIMEDGIFGPAFSEEERRGFSFTLDLGQPLRTDTVECGRRVHYPVVVKQGDKRKRLFYGQTEPYTLASGQEVSFLLVDAFRLEDSSCGDAPEFSIGYVVVGKR